MKPQKKPASKIATGKANTNRKIPDNPESVKTFDTALIRKNEFALILAGALVLTLVVFFVFFRTPAPKGVTATASMASSEKVSALDTRVAALEEKLALPSSGGMQDSKSQNKAVETLTQRVARLETAFSLKFDSMLDRLAGLEKRMAEMAATPVSSAGSQKSTAVDSTQKEKNTAAVPMKKAVKKSNLFHTVKKGETLYSISRQYDTTVDRLRELNNLSKKADIYPGNNILVR